MDVVRTWHRRFADSHAAELGRTGQRMGRVAVGVADLEVVEIVVDDA